MVQEGFELGWQGRQQLQALAIRWVIEL